MTTILPLPYAASKPGGLGRSAVSSTSPFLGVLFSWTVLGKPVLLVQVVAAGLMVVALYALLTAKHAHEHGHESQVHTHAHTHDDEHHDRTHEGLDLGTRHIHEHAHEPRAHAHPHAPGLHQRHEH